MAPKQAKNKHAITSNAISANTLRTIAIVARLRPAAYVHANLAANILKSLELKQWLCAYVTCSSYVAAGLIKLEINPTAPTRDANVET